MASNITITGSNNESNFVLESAYASIIDNGKDTSNNLTVVDVSNITSDLSNVKSDLKTLNTFVKDPYALVPSKFHFPTDPSNQGAVQLLHTFDNSAQLQEFKDTSDYVMNNWQLGRTHTVRHLDSWASYMINVTWSYVENKKGNSGITLYSSMFPSAREAQKHVTLGPNFGYEIVNNGVYMFGNDPSNIDPSDPSGIATLPRNTYSSIPASTVMGVVLDTLFDKPKPLITINGFFDPSVNKVVYPPVNPNAQQNFIIFQDVSNALLAKTKAQAFFDMIKDPSHAGPVVGDARGSNKTHPYVIDAMLYQYTDYWVKFGYPATKDENKFFTVMTYFIDYAAVTTFIADPSYTSFITDNSNCITINTFDRSEWEQPKVYKMLLD